MGEEEIILLLPFFCLEKGKKGVYTWKQKIMISLNLFR